MREIYEWMSIKIYILPDKADGVADKLISKLQYPFYETGEFEAETARTLVEVEALIAAYPWQENCLVTSVGVEMHGVVIEDTAGNYLKIGNYYYGQYSMYLYTRSGRYYKCIAENLPEVLAAVTNFYDGQDVTTGMSRQHDLNVKRHFISKDFIYTVTAMRTLRFMFFTVLATIPFSVFLYAFMASQYAVPMFGLWMLVCGINWLLFVNYLLQSGNLFLKVSAHNNKFLFGTRGHLVEYDKEDINMIITYAFQGASKGPPWVGFEVYKVLFNNGTEIRFTSLLISSYTLPGKFGNVPVRIVRKIFPFARLKNCNQ